MDRMLTTEEAARRLGVKVPTLYAYVSRGLLVSHRDPARRGSLFDLAEIEGLAVRSRGGRQTATRLATVTTGVTQLDQSSGPLYRGRPATELAAGVELRGGGRAAVAVRRPRATGRAPDLGPCPLTHTSTACAGRSSCAAPPTRCGPTCRPAAVARAARRAAAALADVVGPPPAGEDGHASIAARLAARLTAVRQLPCRPPP